jgi:hypothetical protein
MSFPFENATYMRFVKIIDFMLIRFVLKEDAPAIQHGLGIEAALFLTHFAGQFTDQSTPDGVQSSGCMFRFFSAGRFSGRMPTDAAGGRL